MTLIPWLIALAAIHLWTAFGIRGYAFPDEWYQTLELAGLLAPGLSHGHATFSQEIGLHLRNLSWPALLTLPLGLADLIAPGNITARFGLAHALSGLLELLRVWGIWQVLSSALGLPSKRSPLSPSERPRAQFRALGMALSFLPHFVLVDSIRLHGEHLSSIAFWVAAGLIARARLGLAGFAMVAIGAARYPSGILSLGLLLGLVLQKRWSALPRVFIGIAVGLLVFGWADWAVYGRPWESLWMYLQYNVFTGLSAKNFGAETSAIYWHFFAWRWSRGFFLIPVALLILVGFVRQTPAFIRAREPWFVAAVLYLVAHCLIGHKEERFMIPLESILTIGGVIGLASWNRFGNLFGSFLNGSTWSRTSKCVAFAVVSALILANTIAAIQPAFLGDRFKYTGPLTSVGQTARDHAACGIIVERMLPSLATPDSPTLGFVFPLKDDRSAHRLVWYEAKPDCSAPGSRLLVYLTKDYWPALRAQCETFGADRFWRPQLFALCGPDKLASLFGALQESTEHPRVTTFGRLEKLPQPRISGEELVRLGIQAVPQPPCRYLCYGLER